MLMTEGGKKNDLLTGCRTNVILIRAASDVVSQIQLQRDNNQFSVNMWIINVNNCYFTSTKYSAKATWVLIWCTEKCVSVMKNCCCRMHLVEMALFLSLLLSLYLLSLSLPSPQSHCLCRLHSELLSSHWWTVPIYLQDSVSGYCLPYRLLSKLDCWDLAVIHKHTN